MSWFIHISQGSGQDGGTLPRAIDVIFNSIEDLQTKKYQLKPDKLNGFEIQNEADAAIDRWRLVDFIWLFFKTENPNVQATRAGGQHQGSEETWHKIKQQLQRGFVKQVSKKTDPFQALSDAWNDK